MEPRNARLLQVVQRFPSSPGVYLMRDSQGNVVYAGKAASLKDRVRSYFAAPDALPIKTRKLMGHVTEVEYIVTDSEAEALILEGNLIKQHKPRYNVRLKDDKAYPYLKIDVDEPWPQVFITRRVANDGARYFGPYANSGSVRQTMALVKKLFPYRSCNKAITGTDPRPCLDYHIKRCLGPCIGAVSPQDYSAVIKQVILFLEGKQDQVVKDLRSRMDAAAEDLQFERAAFLRDQIRAVERVVERQKIVSVKGEDQDVIAFAQDGSECCVQVFLIRDGKVFGTEHFMLDGAQDEAPGAIMASFIEQYYGSAPQVPPAILLQYPAQDEEVITQWLRERRGGAVELRVPQRGEKRRLVEMVAENARQKIQQLRVKWLADTGKTAAALTELQELLDLPRLPARMECYDISNISGTSAVGSMVVFEEGVSKPSAYRRFRIKAVAGIDDYAMMQEVLRRRFKRAAVQVDVAGAADGASDVAEDLSEEIAVSRRSRDEGSWGVLPDLVIIDGGRGHLSAALQVMLELGLGFIPLCALAKQQEEVFLPHVSESVLPPKGSQGLYLLQRIRDEAHRFAITYHRQVRSKAAVDSALDSIPGIGPKRRRALIRRFGSVRGIKQAPVEEIAAVASMTRTLAEKVKLHA